MGASCCFALEIQAEACRSYVEGSCAFEGIDRGFGLVVEVGWLADVVIFDELG